MSKIVSHGDSPLSERQARIVDRLSELSPALAELFQIAVRENRERIGQAWIRIGAHAARELVNRLPDYLDIPLAGKRIDYAQRFRPIAERWPENATELPSDEVLDLVARLVEDDRTATASIRKRAESLFTSLETGEVVYAGDAAARARLWVALQRYFPAVAHLSGPTVAEPDPAIFDRHLSHLERLLASQFRYEGYYDTQAELDEHLGKAEPTEEDAEAVVALLRGELYRSFFERARSPKWLPLLRPHGFFRKPPGKVIEAEYVRFPSWPDARYLVAVAPDVPGEVADTIHAMEASDNARVHGDLLEAILALPASEAKSFVDLVGGWLNDGFLMLVAGRAGQLVAMLADEGEAAAAIRLSRHLLVLQQVEADALSYGASFEVKARIDEWEYQQFLQKHFKHVVAAEPLEAMKVLRDVLYAAMILDRKRWRTERDDGMKIARSRIADHEDYPALENALITSLRDALVSSVGDQPDRIEAVVEILTDPRELLFTRLLLHVATTVESPELNGLRRRLLMEAEMRTNYVTEDEYEELLARWYSSLEEDDKRALIEDVEAGPDDEYRAMVRERLAETHEPTEEELEAAWERRRLRQLAPIRGELTGEDATRYAARVSEFGEPRFPDRGFRGVTDYAGPFPKATVEQLRAMSYIEIFGLLSSWKPEHSGWDLPTREGQARALSVLIEEAPDAWAARADKFMAVPPIYTRHFLQNLESAVRAKIPFTSWGPILDLADYVVAQVGDALSSDYEDDADFAPARRALAFLLRTALWSDALPMAFRDRAWPLITALARDPDPGKERDATTTDAAGASINRTRGIALHVAVAYGVWCRRNSPGESTTFDDLPELRDLLEERLDPGQELSPSVHCVFGQFLPQLHWLDGDWIKTHLAEIFPDEHSRAAFRASAWGAFIRFASPDTDVIRLVLAEFRAAVDRLPAEQEQRMHDEHHRLAEYIALIFLQDLDVPAVGVVDHFFTNAAVAYRTQAVRSLGLSLREVSPSEEQQERLLSLWASRLEMLDDGDAELAEFGWWFASGKLQGVTSVELLAATLEKSRGAVDSIKEVVETLAGLALVRPELTVRIVELLVIGSEWYVLDYARSEIRDVVEQLVASEDDIVRAQVRGLIHGLGERGVHGMQDLLT